MAYNKRKVTTPKSKTTTKKRTNAARAKAGATKKKELIAKSLQSGGTTFKKATSQVKTAGKNIINVGKPRQYETKKVAYYDKLGQKKFKNVRKLKK
jgi:hypothetical protein